MTTPNETKMPERLEARGMLLLDGDECLATVFKRRAVDAEIAQELARRWNVAAYLEAKPCVTRIGKSANGKVLVVYLRDGQKITVGRDRAGAAWLNIEQQAMIKSMTTPRQEDGR